MAQNQIDTARIIQFSSAVHVAAQQMKSRLSGIFPIRQMMGKSLAYDGVGSVEVSELTGRFNAVNFTDLAITRRKLPRLRRSLTIPFDSADASQVLINQEAEYAAALVNAMSRAFDRIGIEAAFADVQTGEEFGTTVTFAGEGGLTVNATDGLTYFTLLEIAQNFIDNDVGTDLQEDFVFCISGDEHTQLMKLTELTSGDFSRQMVIDKGEITMAAGFRLVKFAANAPRPILSVASGVRSAPVMCSRGLVYGMPAQFDITVQERTDLVQTSQIQINWILGCLRTEAALIQKVTTVD